MPCLIGLHLHVMALQTVVLSVIAANQGLVKSRGELTLEAIGASATTPSHYAALLQSVRSNARPCQSAEYERYSRVDGVCNNLRDPYRGAVLAVESRLSPNAYLDGREFPRINTANGYLLPSAREVSQKCFGAAEDGDAHEDKLFTQLLWQYGQHLAHDIVFVRGTDGARCCEEAEFCESHCTHTDMFIKDGRCFPMTVPADDSFFNESCMTFVRSFSVDLQGVREQVNGLTSYVDASSIYGASKFHLDQLRLFSRGLLKTTANGNLLPNAGNASCITHAHVTSCPAAGDIRLNTVPGLAAMHTLFHLEHNRIAEKLALLNNLWNDERIFQETRKIMIGIVQKITYEDYLPKVLGKTVMSRFGIDAPYVYDDSVDPSAINEFTTAAFRHGHSMINTFLLDEPLSDTYFRPITRANYVKEVLHYQAENLSLKMNSLFTSQIRDLLFKNVPKEHGPDRSAFPGPSFDLTARNIQRGRDHGLPPFTVVRDACRQLLQGMSGVVQGPSACLAQGVYRSEEDIDLFVGGISETPLEGSLLGPTFACLTAIQFQRLKFGDRFFYEGNGLEGFTDGQRDFLRRNTMASFICELDDAQFLQPDVFRAVSDSNPLVPCKEILQNRNLDQGLQMWKDNPFLS